MDTAEQISLALEQATGSAVRHEAVRIQGDASSRQYFRVRTHDTLWPSLVAMVLPEDALGSDEGGDGALPDEIPFVSVQRYLAAGGLPVPEIIGVSEEASVILLEDLGKTHLGDLGPGTRSPWYEQAVDQIVALQKLGAEKPDPECLVFGRAFDARLLFWELEHFVVNSLVRRRNVELTAPERDEVDRLFHLVSERLAGEQRVLVHRDFQSRNLLIHEERLRFIDFQDALMGTRAYDLVSLLRDSYVELTDQEARSLLDRYAKAAAVDQDQLGELFDWQTVQRKLKDAGRFDFLDLVKGNDGYLRYIPLTLRHVRGAALRHPELTRLIEVFARYIPELGTG